VRSVVTVAGIEVLDARAAGAPCRTVQWFEVF
jgi:hypothetical protein